MNRTIRYEQPSKPNDSKFKIEDDCEETSIKELLGDLSDVLNEISILEENKVYKAKEFDGDSTEIVDETPLERAKNLASAAMVCYVMQIHEMLGYENK